MVFRSLCKTKNVSLFTSYFGRHFWNIFLSPNQKNLHFAVEMKSEIFIQVFFKIGIFENLTKFTGKHLYRSLFFKTWGPSPFLEKRASDIWQSYSRLYLFLLQLYIPSSKSFRKTKKHNWGMLYSMNHREQDGFSPSDEAKYSQEDSPWCS